MTTKVGLAINKNTIKYLDFYNQLDRRLYDVPYFDDYIGLLLYDDKQKLIKSLDKNHTYIVYSTLTGSIPRNIKLLNQPIKYTSNKIITYDIVRQIGYGDLIPNYILVMNKDDIARQLKIAITRWDKIIIKPTKGKGGDVSAFYIKRTNDIVVGNKFGYKAYNKNTPQETIILEIIKHMVCDYNIVYYDEWNRSYESQQHAQQVITKLRQKIQQNKTTISEFMIEPLYMDNDGFTATTKLYVVITNHDKILFDVYGIFSQSYQWFPYASSWFGQQEYRQLHQLKEPYNSFIRDFISFLHRQNIRIVDLSFDFIYDPDDDSIYLLEINSRPSKDFVEFVDDDLRNKILESYTNAITSAYLHYSNK